MYIVVDRPSAMTSHNTIGCYEITFENNGNGNQFSRGASVWDTRDNCASSTGQETGLIQLAPGNAEEIVFQIQDTGGGSTLPYEIRVQPADMEEDNTLIGLDGQDPGQTVRGEIRFFGSTAEVGVQVEALGYDPFRFFNIVLVANPGDEEVVLDSVGVRPIPTEAPERGNRARPSSAQ